MHIDPDNLQALILCGIASYKAGNPLEAIDRLERLQKLEPNSFEAALWLSRCCRKLARRSEATDQARKALQLSAGSAVALNQLGLSLLDQQLYDEAAVRFLEAIPLDSGAFGLYIGLGLALQGTGRVTEAIRAFRKALELKPTSRQGLQLLYQALANESDTSGALECARNLFAREPNSAEAGVRLALALAVHGRADEARDLLARFERSKMSAGLSLAIASVHQMLGDIQAAQEGFRRSISLEPRQGAAYASFAYSHRMGKDDLTVIIEMQRLTADASVSAEHRSLLHFGIGKSNEDMGQYADAMENFDLANQLGRQSRFGDRPFDRVQYLERVEARRARSCGALH